MVDTPARLVLKGREKRIMHCIADLDYRATDEFAKPLLVTEFFAKSNACHEDNLLAQDGDLEYLAWYDGVGRWNR